MEDRMQNPGTVSDMAGCVGWEEEVSLLCALA